MIRNNMGAKDREVYTALTNYTIETPLAVYPEKSFFKTIHTGIVTSRNKTGTKTI